MGNFPQPIEKRVVQLLSSLQRRVLRLEHLADDPIAIGTQLARTSIASPNYVPGSTGWSLNASGTGEMTPSITVAAGGVNVTIGATPPASPHTGDLWFDATNNYRLSQWSGTAWTAFQFGTNAIAAGSVTAALIAAGTIFAGIVNGTVVQGAQVIADGTSGQVLVYNGPAGPGNLIFSVSGAVGSDSFGNTWPVGVALNQGLLSGVGAESMSVMGGNIGPDSAGNLPTASQLQLTNPGIGGGTIDRADMTFDPAGGNLLMYSTTTSTVLQTASGSYQFTVPAGVTSLKVECWGAGAGGGGGTSPNGGYGGGGGEYACEPNYPVTPGQVISYIVGDAGSGGVTGSPGGDGGTTTFDIVNQGVVAHGGLASGGGPGGTGSTNSIHYNGGNGAANNGTIGGGGGGSAGSTGPGGNSVAGSGAGGSAGPGGGASAGNGGANNANGGNGNAPGAGGGGAGGGTTTGTFNKTYTCTASHSYQGNDGGNPNLKINDNGSAYQGGDYADTYNGRSKTWFVFNKSQIVSDLSGVSIQTVKVTLNNNHTWYHSGMTVALGYDNTTSFGSSMGNPSGGGIDATEFSVAEGATITKDVTGHGFATAFQGGSAACLVVFKNSNSLNYYGYFAGANQSGPAQIQFIGTTAGSGAYHAGSGSDGQVRITYTSTSTLMTSLAAVSGTDDLSNPFPAGIATAQPLQLTNQAVPTSITGAAELYAVGGHEKYVGSDGNAYNTGRQTVIASGSNTLLTTGLATVLGLSAPLAIGTYRIRAQLILNVAATAGQGTLSYRLQPTGGLVAGVGRISITELYSGNIVGLADYQALGSSLSGSTPGTGAANRMVTFDGWFTVTVAGTINVQAAQGATVGATAIVMGSYLEIMPVT